MSRYIPIILALALSACGTKPAADVFALRASYDATVLAPASHYASLPRCPTADNVCSEQKVVDALRKADKTAQAALDAAETIARDNPQLDASTAIKAAEAAVSLGVQIIATYNVK